MYRFYLSLSLGKSLDSSLVRGSLWNLLNTQKPALDVQGKVARRSRDGRDKALEISTNHKQRTEPSSDEEGGKTGGFDGRRDKTRY